MRKNKEPKKSESKPQFVVSARELPATQGMLQLVRTELKADIRGLGAENKAGFAQMDSKFERVLSDVARIGVLVEEQNSNNRVVLEGLTGLWRRQERIEGRMEDVEQLVRSIGRPRT